jgi:hypothetical protein
MKAIPKKTTGDIRKLLPRHLHGNNGGQGDQMFPDNSPGQHHAAVPAMISNALNGSRPNAERENRQLNADVLRALTDNKRLEAEDMGVSRFVIVWRMYPNKDNPVVQRDDPNACGCGCSCGG